MKAPLALLAIVLTLSCARTKPASLPPPPETQTPEVVIPKRTYPKLTPPRPGDLLVKNCSIMGQPSDVPNAKTDCICRKASTVIDAKDPAKSHGLICK